MISVSDTELNLCPCCGVELPPGLFEKMQIVQTPAQIQVASDQPAQRIGRLLRFSGRYFTSAIAPLPLNWTGSPVRAAVWVELDRGDAESLADADYDSPEESYELTARGSLACDIPGFPGTLGARCEIAVSSQMPTAQLVACGDVRVASLPIHPNHQQLVELYRRIWGQADEPVAPADQNLRAAAARYWQSLLPHKELTETEVTPPPHLSGIDPPKLLLAPPSDTGDQTVLMTVGCAEGSPASGTGVELITWVRDPEMRFIDCFGEFLFLTRSNAVPITTGMVIPERGWIPGSEQRMRGWLLCEPWWVELEPFSSAEEQVTPLAAVPLYEAEMVMAATAGADTLIGMLRDSDLDISSLKRDAAVGGFGVSGV